MAKTSNDVLIAFLAVKDLEIKTLRERMMQLEQTNFDLVREYNELYDVANQSQQQAKSIGFVNEESDEDTKE